MKKYICGKEQWSIDEWIKIIPDGLYPDAVGLWTFIPFLQEAFDLTDKENLYYIRMTLDELYNQGARPVIFAQKDSPYDWILQPQYGFTKKDIADNIIKEWQESGKNPDTNGIWFYIPDEYCFIP